MLTYSLKSGTKSNTENFFLTKSKNRKGYILDYSNLQSLYRCNKFKQMNVIKRTGIVKSNNLCHSCLNNHMPNLCISKNRRFSCNSKKHTLLHPFNKSNNSSQQFRVEDEMRGHILVSPSPFF